MKAPGKAVISSMETGSSGVNQGSWRNVDDPTDLICVGSLAELGELVGCDLSDLDPHRFFIDDVEIVRDGATYRRVPEVIDAWFDSGSMPFAQWGYPHVPGSAEKVTTKETASSDTISFCFCAYMIKKEDWASSFVLPPPTTATSWPL